MRRDAVVEGIDYSATATPGGVTVTMRRHVITFVAEEIPDGQMAGMIGHRPVPHVEEVSFEIPTAQARVLLHDFRVALAYEEARRR